MLIILLNNLYVDSINTATCKSLNDYETYDKIYTNEFLDNTKLYETALSYHSFGTFKENTKEYLMSYTLKNLFI